MPTRREALKLGAAVVVGAAADRLAQLGSRRRGNEIGLKPLKGEKPSFPIVSTAYDGGPLSQGVHRTIEAEISRLHNVSGGRRDVFHRIGLPLTHGNSAFYRPSESSNGKFFFALGTEGTQPTPPKAEQGAREILHNPVSRYDPTSPLALEDVRLLERNIQLALLRNGITHTPSARIEKSRSGTYHFVVTIN